MSKKTLTVIVAVAIVVGVVAAYMALRQQLSNQEPSTNEWKTYQNEDLGIKLQFPSSWPVEYKKSVRLFSENGPMGDRLSGGMYNFSISRIAGDSSMTPMAFFETTHSGDQVKVNRSNEMLVGPDKENFIYIEEDGSWRGYITMKNGYYWEISYFDPQNSNVSNEVEKILSSFQFVSRLDMSDWKTYSNEDFGFEVKYPTAWIPVPYGTESKIGFRDASVMPNDVNWVPVWIAIRDYKNNEDLSKKTTGEDEALIQEFQGESFSTDGGVTGYYFRSLPGVVTLDVVVLMKDGKVYEISKINNQGRGVEEVFDRMTHEIQFTSDIDIAKEIEDRDKNYEKWLSVPEVTVGRLKDYLSANHGFDREKVLVKIVEVAGSGIYGQVVSRGKPSGAHFLAEDQIDSIKMIYVGQDALPCAEIEAFGFTVKKVPVCWDDQDNVLQQRGEE